MLTSIMQVESIRGTQVPLFQKIEGTKMVENSPLFAIVGRDALFDLERVSKNFAKFSVWYKLAIKLPCILCFLYTFHKNERVQ